MFRFEFQIRGKQLSVEATSQEIDIAMFEGTTQVYHDTVETPERSLDIEALVFETSFTLRVAGEAVASVDVDRNKAINAHAAPASGRVLFSTKNFLDARKRFWREELARIVKDDQQ